MPHDSLPAPLARWREQLQTILEDSDPSGSAEARTFLRRVDIAEIIAAICSDDVVIADIAADSYRHVLGFDKYVLLNCGTAGQLRLHVWWPGDARAPEHVHNHRFSFASRVVCGRMIAEFYERADAGQLVNEHKEASVENRQQWEFTTIGPARLTMTTRAELSPDSYYVLRSDAFHRIDVPRSDLTVSLLLQTKLVRPWSTVFTEQSAMAPRPLPQTRFEPAQLRDRFLRLTPLLPRESAAAFVGAEAELLG